MRRRVAESAQEICELAIGVVAFSLECSALLGKPLRALCVRPNLVSLEIVRCWLVLAALAECRMDFDALASPCAVAYGACPAAVADLDRGIDRCVEPPGPPRPTPVRHGHRRDRSARGDPPPRLIF
jgi:hypothetical protein